jgi:hypothetical protein
MSKTRKGWTGVFPESEFEAGGEPHAANTAMQQTSSQSVTRLAINSSRHRR